MVLAALMRRFVLELVPGQSVWPVIDFTMKPRDGLRMTVTGRLSGRDPKQRNDKSVGTWLADAGYAARRVYSWPQKQSFRANSAS